MDVAITAASPATDSVGKDAAGCESCSSDSNPHRALPWQQTAGASDFTAINTSGSGHDSRRDTADRANYLEDSGAMHSVPQTIRPAVSSNTALSLGGTSSFQDTADSKSCPAECFVGSGAAYSPPQKARPAVSSTAHSSGGASYYQDTALSESSPSESGAHDSLEWGSSRSTSKHIHAELTRRVNEDPPPDFATSSAPNGNPTAAVDVSYISPEPMPNATLPSRHGVRRFSAKRSEPIQSRQRTTLAESNRHRRRFHSTTTTKATKSGYLAAAERSSIPSEPIPGPKSPTNYRVPGFTASSLSAPIPSHRGPTLVIPHVTNDPDLPTGPTAPKTTNDGHAVSAELSGFSADALDYTESPASVVQDSVEPTQTHTSFDSFLPPERGNPSPCYSFLLLLKHGPVADTRPTRSTDYCTALGASPILTPELIALAEEAVSTYELLRSTQIDGLLPDVMYLPPSK
ncbi:hypothetical protein HYPSUDRAFT_207030 [Hypholoma sublateritium FD-334 SS-4]|uniref:Uncharacterized protein n=1 Tax=Hypholoma sublateritium (strain FD-334 SS-4) TaxID=945553 RepID=A0A0D2P7T6_HYPSF|nr:hypothetical protein HYPSUDRAFT_207030 [Hypholoma sublateritium FD-334 SS-4]